jgi:hypothetical protein
MGRPIDGGWDDRLGQSGAEKSLTKRHAVAPNIGKVGGRNGAQIGAQHLLLGILWQYLVMQHQAIIGKPGADKPLQGLQVEARLFRVANQVHSRQAPADKIGLHIKPTGIDGGLQGVLR